MTRNAIFSDDEALDFQPAPGFGTQLLALATAACVGAGLFFSSVLVGTALFFAVAVTMNIDAGTEWGSRIHKRLQARQRRVLRHVLSPQ